MAFDPGILGGATSAAPKVDASDRRHYAMASDKTGDKSIIKDFDAALAAQRKAAPPTTGQTTPSTGGGRSMGSWGDEPTPPPPQPDAASTGGGRSSGSWGDEPPPQPQQANAAVAALPLAGTLALADGPLPIGDALALGVLGGALIYTGYQYFNQSDAPTVHQAQATQPGFTGEPGSIVTVNNPDGTPRQTRTYGEDGYPVKDIDYNHDHGQGQPHVHDWGRSADGSPPTHKDREPGRAPDEGEVD